MGQNWSVAVAAAVVILVARGMVRRQAVSPVVVVSGVLPLGAAVAMFNAIVEVMRVSVVKGDALDGAAVALSANLGKVFTTSLAIALGLGAGLAIMRAVRREEFWEEAFARD